MKGTKNQNQQKQKTINPIAIKKLYLKQYSKNPNFSNWEPNEKIMALSNRYGFLGILNLKIQNESNNIQVIYDKQLDKIFIPSQNILSFLLF